MGWVILCPLVYVAWVHRLAEMMSGCCVILSVVMQVGTLVRMIFLVLSSWRISWILMAFPSKVVSCFRMSVSCGEVVVRMMLPIRVVVNVVLSWGRARSMARTCEYSSVQSSVCKILKLVFCGGSWVLFLVAVFCSLLFFLLVDLCS